MKLIGRVSLLMSVACVVFAIPVASAPAALPELGRCVQSTPTMEGKRKKFSGKFRNKTCTKTAPAGDGHWEWSPGPGETKTYEDLGATAAVKLETTSGAQIACADHKLRGEYTGPTTQTASLTLFECVETATNEPCETIDTSETPPTYTNGLITSQALEAELGHVGTAHKKPLSGWDFKPKAGNDMFVFECAEIPSVSAPSEPPTVPTEPPALPTEPPAGLSASKASSAQSAESASDLIGLGNKYVVEGSFIEPVLEPRASKMTPEFIEAATASKGVQQPESFEGGATDTLMAEVITGVTPTTEAIGYSTGNERIANGEPLEIKSIP
ncbi:MAG TPA: hypothetical protein VLZ06_02115 [Solirubrobacteraceae bacterium]|nr:hypothetical protein [Solirubrobacteraceae bacterium]